MKIGLAKNVALMAALASSHDGFYPITPLPGRRDEPKIKGITGLDIERMKKAELKRERKAAKRLSLFK